MSDTSSSSDSSDNEQFYFYLNEINRNVVPKNKNYVEETVPQYNNEQFISHFRISRDIFTQLVENYSQSQYFNEGSGAYGRSSAVNDMLMFLWFAGHQTASFRDVADRFDITISSLFRITEKVIHFLSDMSAQIIKWPNEEEQNIIENHFSEKLFPGVIGVVDGCHIKIDKPREDPDSYLNRKHFFSIQMQVVCDHERRIRDIFIGYPGSVHDSRVFRNSPLPTILEEKCRARKYIIGDSGFPCTSKLLTPFRDNGHLNEMQQHFNTILSKNRYVIEHCFGILKQKFRQLYHVKLQNIERICHFIRACCVLHNLAINDDFEYDLVNIPDINIIRNIQDNNDDEERDDDDGINLRSRVAQRIFPG